jgi:hypothetical protein
VQTLKLRAISPWSGICRPSCLNGKRGRKGEEEGREEREERKERGERKEREREERERRGALFEKNVMLVSSTARTTMRWILAT